MLSFIVPAHNEERWIGKCLSSIRATMEKVSEPYEVIVVDDASTDATHPIALRMGASTLRVEHRKISAVRNAGAQAASGEAAIPIMTIRAVSLTPPFMGVSRRHMEEKTVSNGFRTCQRVSPTGLKPLKTVLVLWPRGPTPMNGGVNVNPPLGPSVPRPKSS